MARVMIEDWLLTRERKLADGYAQGECHFATGSTTANVKHSYRDQRFVKPRDHWVLEGGYRPAICDECADAHLAFLAAVPR